jgi:hypothetical protein
MSNGHGRSTALRVAPVDIGRQLMFRQCSARPALPAPTPARHADAHRRHTEPLARADTRPTALARPLSSATERTQLAPATRRRRERSEQRCVRLPSLSPDRGADLGRAMQPIRPRSRLPRTSLRPRSAGACGRTVEDPFGQGCWGTDPCPEACRQPQPTETRVCTSQQRRTSRCASASRTRQDQSDRAWRSGDQDRSRST